LVGREAVYHYDQGYPSVHEQELRASTEAANCRLDVDVNLQALDNPQRSDQGQVNPQAHW